MLHRILKELETRIGKEKLHNVHDYEYDEGKKVRTYYDYKGSTYPGFSYIYKKGVKPGVDIWFRIEIDLHLYAGFVVVANGQATKQVLTEEEIKLHLPHLSPYVDNWWATWDFIPFDDEDQSPNFKDPDEHDIYYRLFDKDYFAIFIAESMKKIDKLFV